MPKIGYHPTDETRQKISIANKNSPKVKAHLINVWELNTGKIGWSHGLTKKTDPRLRGGREKGWFHTEDTKHKIAIAHIGKQVSDETKLKQSESHKGVIPWSKGKTKDTDVRIAKIANSLRGKHKTTPNWNLGLTKETTPSIARMANQKSLTNWGDNNPNWKGGNSFHSYNISFNKNLKLKIRTRDNFTCQYPDCNITEQDIAHDVHHIDYDKNNSTDSNLITLCHLHNGKVNSNRTYWTQYFSILLLNSIGSEPIKE
jgi:hypothetical protein